MKKRSKIMWIAILVIMSVLSGCGKNGKGIEKTGEKTGSTNNGMGRYVEESIQFPVDIVSNIGVAKQKDGSYLSLDCQMGLFESTDQGNTWNQKDANWIKELGINAYIHTASLSADGEFAIIYALPNNDDSYTPMYKYISSDGSMLDLVLPEGNEENFIAGYAFEESGRLFCYDANGKVYEVDKKTGSMVELFEVSGYIDNVSIVGSKIIVVYNKEIQLYDLLSGQVEEADTVLTNFLRDSTMVANSMNVGASPVIFAPGKEENSIYLACKGGLYYHVLGGSVMEQMIDGNLSTFGDPSSSLISLTVEEGDTFLVLFAGNGFVRYTYDKTVATVPDTELKIFSLEDNQTIRQAISLYQKSNLDVYINFEIGMSGNDGVTKEDAIKNLNTQIMAGEGPDIMIMDGLSVNTYVEKGMLLDITSVITDTEIAEQLFDNITKAYQRDEKVYAVPSKFKLPIMAGDSQYVNSITDLPSLLSSMQQIREQKAEGNILDIYTEKELLHMLSLGSSPSWINEDGSVNQDALTEFLTYSKQIYELEKQGITPAMEQKYQDTNYSFNGVTEELYISASANALDLLTGKQMLVCGYINGINMDYSMLTSVFSSLKKPGTIHNLSLQSQNVYMPESIIGINAKTQNVDTAKNFIKELLSEQVQDINLGDGIPVNKKSFDKILEDNTASGEETDGIGMVSLVGDDDDGQRINLEINKISMEEAENLKSMIENLHTPGITDDMILNCMLDLGPSALNGEKDVKVVVTEIMNKVQIRLDE